MKDVIDWAKIWVADFPRQQDFPLEPLAQGRIVGNLGKNCFQRDMHALQEAVFRLIDFAHPSFAMKRRMTKRLIST